MKNVAIVIINYNASSDTKECLSSLDNAKKTDINLNVIVVDNASKEEFKIQASPVRKSQDSPREFIPRGKKLKIEIKIIRSEINLGFSGGNNLGIKHALNEGAEYIVLLNNDTIVDKNFLISLLQGFGADNNNGIASPKIYFTKGFEFHKDRYKNKDLGRVIWYGGGMMDWKNILASHRGVDEIDHGQYDELQQTDFATGCCMLIKREIFDTVGFLDEKLFLYYEDSDFSMRVKKAGFNIVFIPKSLIWHKNAGSTGGSGSDLQDYFITRNRMLFGMKYAPLRAKLSLLRESLIFLFRGRKWQKQGIIDYYMGKFGKGSFELENI